MWKKYDRARQATDDDIIRRMRFACWITEVTDTHSEYVILIPCLRQKWLRESSWILRCSTLPFLFETILDPVLQKGVPVTTTLLLFLVHCVTGYSLYNYSVFFLFSLVMNTELVCLIPGCYGECLDWEVSMWPEAVGNYEMKVTLSYIMFPFG